MTLILAKTLITIAILFVANCVAGGLTVGSWRAQLALKASAAVLAASGVLVGVTLLWVA